MKKIQSIVVIIMIFLVSGCSGAMSGTVVDDETGKPIGGAIVYVEWTKTKGIGLSHTETYKVIETTTNKEGKFKVSGVLGLFVNPPIIVIYKNGYVAWRNEYIFPGLAKRSDYQGGDNYIFKLTQFRRNYSHSQHISFIEIGGLSHSSTKLDEAFSWEIPMAQRERKYFGEISEQRRLSKYSEKEIWDEVVKKLYP